MFTVNIVRIPPKSFLYAWDIHISIRLGGTVSVLEVNLVKVLISIFLTRLLTTFLDKAVVQAVYILSFSSSSWQG
jgi:hypothetical protein